MTTASRRPRSAATTPDEARHRKAAPVLARGVRLDIAGVGSVEMRAQGRADVRAALERRGMADFALAGGDVVVFHTDRSRLWKEDDARLNSGEPGIGMGVAHWHTDEVHASVIGADPGTVEVVPAPDSTCAFRVRQSTIVRYGVFLHENLHPDAPIGDRIRPLHLCPGPTASSRPPVPPADPSRATGRP